MKTNIFIGVDGGGTKTKVRIEDAEGNLVSEGSAGSSNIRFSVMSSWKSINQAIQEALEKSRYSLSDQNIHFHVGLGLAGCEVRDAVNAFLSYTHPFYTLDLRSDAHMACLGAHEGEDGAIIIIGTGIVGYQIVNDKNFKVGGWGFPHDDVGSGAWLGLEAARLTFEWLDDRAERSDLTHAVFSFFNEDQLKFCEWANGATAPDFACLAPLVIKQSQLGESSALALMKKSAHSVEKIVTALDKSSNASKLKYCLLGGIASFIEPLLSDEVRHRMTLSKGDAAHGAARMIREKYEKKSPVCLT